MIPDDSHHLLPTPVRRLLAGEPEADCRRSHARASAFTVSGTAMRRRCLCALSALALCAATRSSAAFTAAIALASVASAAAVAARCFTLKLLLKLFADGIFIPKPPGLPPPSPPLPPFTSSFAPPPTAFRRVMWCLCWTFRCSIRSGR